MDDLFDLWLYPLNVVPWTVGQIIEANPLITEALQRCVQKVSNMYYIAGNHDMGIIQKDLEPFNSGGKKIQLISADDYNTKYKNLRHLEHGHAVDIFDAPNDPIFSGKDLSLFEGYALHGPLWV